MSIASYSDLQTSVGTLLNRGDLTSQIPDWITLCEASLNRDLDCRQMQDTSTITLTAETYPLPTDFGGVKSLRLNSGVGVHLDYLSPDLLDGMSTTAGVPTAYSISGENLYFNPPPNGTMTARLRYRKLIPALSDTNTTNWVLARYPDLYLYGTAVHSAPYLQFDERLSMWAAIYANLVTDINAESRKESEGSTLQTVSGFYG